MKQNYINTVDDEVYFQIKDCSVGAQFAQLAIITTNKVEKGDLKFSSHLYVRHNLQYSDLLNRKFQNFLK